MNNNCKNLKQKLDRTLFCKKKNKLIKISECNNCIYKEYKTTCHTSLKSSQKSKKLAKLERNRFSILTDDLEHCIVCGAKRENLHEIFFGTGNRVNSMKFGCVIPICLAHHTEMHKNKEWQEYWHKLGQKKFMEYYHKSIDEFIDIFKKSYF